MKITKVKFLVEESMFDGSVPHAFISYSINKKQVRLMAYHKNNNTFDIDLDKYFDYSENVFYKITNAIKEYFGDRLFSNIDYWDIIDIYKELIRYSYNINYRWEDNYEN